MLKNSVFGKKISYRFSYDASLLFPISRGPNRSLLGGIEKNLPFQGVDIWNAYEISWLNAKGKPMIALGEFIFPCTSPCIIESKSCKFYLNSFNQSHFSSPEVVRATLQSDLTHAAQAEVTVKLIAVDTKTVDTKTVNRYLSREFRY